MQGSNSYQAVLPPGYRFRPTVEELVCHYLRKKVSGANSFRQSSAVRECDLYGEKEPWQIWEERGGRSGEDLYFFTTLKTKTSRGTRKDRKVGTGIWHGQVKGVKVESESDKRLVGMIRRFQYWNSKSVHDKGWIMLEYSLVDSAQPIVLCRLRKSPGNNKNKNVDASPSSRITNPHQASAALDSLISNPHQASAAIDSLIRNPHQASAAMDSRISNPHQASAAINSMIRNAYQASAAMDSLISNPHEASAAMDTEEFRDWEDGEIDTLLEQ